jgi:hypothetical protein
MTSSARRPDGSLKLTSFQVCQGLAVLAVASGAVHGAATGTVLDMPPSKPIA